jgi:hypothetical protein
MTVHLRPTALEDILAAGRFYDTQGGGLGDQVVDFLQSRMKELELTGGMPPQRSGFFQMAVQGTFPYYVIYYSLELDGVHVRAVVDHRQDPKTTRRRLREV